MYIIAFDCWKNTCVWKCFQFIFTCENILLAKTSFVIFPPTMSWMFVNVVATTCIILIFVNKVASTCIILIFVNVVSSIFFFNLIT